MTRPDPLPWLLEPDNPSARYLTLTDVLDRPAGDREVEMARRAIPAQGPARAILDAQWPAGYWMRPGVGYSPKYKATVWQILFLAALGTPRTEALDRVCAYVLDHSRLPDGRFSAHKTAKGATTCLNGNLLRAFFRLDYRDPRLEGSLEALVEMVASDRFCCRFNALRPLPTSMGDGLPCAWGAVKALAAFAEIPEQQRSSSVRRAIRHGVSFLLEGNLALGDYPTATGPSPFWHRLGFPLGYRSDLVEALEVLGRMGVGHSPALVEALRFVEEKRDPEGRWQLEHTLPNTWATFGQVNQPNKWVTIRALRALRYWA